jgi:hypothetical protein
MKQSSETKKQITIMMELIDFLTKLNTMLNSTSGRDKITKCLQSSGKIVVYLLDRHLEKHGENELVRTARKKVYSFESNLSMARKVFRFGKFISGYLSFYEFMKKLKSILDYWRIHGSLQGFDVPLTIYEALSNIQKFIMANFFFFDMFNWCAKIGILFSDPLPKNGLLWFSKDFFNIRYKLNNHRASEYNQYGSNLWFCSICLLLILDVLKMVESYKKEVVLLKELHEQVVSSTLNTIKQIQNTTQVTLDSQIESPKCIELRSQLQKVYKERDKHFMVIARNICDFGIASDLVGLWSISNGTNGLLGLFSAILGAIEIWPEK